MFNPSREQVRQFFFDAWTKHRNGTPLAGLEVTAVDALLAHPEYRDVLDAPDSHRDRDYTPEQGETNPFLHLSMHLTIEEQVSIDQPRGIRAEFERIAAKLGDRHAATHVAMECLGEMVWRSQRDGAPPDALAYLECLRKR